MAVPAAQFNPFAGSSGDFKCVVLTDDPNVDFQIIPGMAPVPTTMVGSMKWTLTPNKLASPEFIGHNSPVSGGGALNPLQLKGGKQDWGIKLEQTLDGNSGTGLSSAVRLPMGYFVYFQLIFHKSQNYGYSGYAKIVGFEPGTSDAEQTQKPVGLSIDLKGHGALPLPSFIA